MDQQQNITDADKTAKALKKFICFLYVGNDRPYYDATKFYKKEDYYAEGKHMRNLEFLLSDEDYKLVPLDKIKLAMDSGLVRNPDSLMFALAMCGRQKTCENLRSSTYYFVTEHCKEWKLFVGFIAFSAYLFRMEKAEKEKDEAKEGFGSGRGWRNAVNKWYLNQDATDLAILTSRYKSTCGIKHRDILKLSHVNYHGMDVEKQVVLTYTIDGLHAASKKFMDAPDAQKQLDYLIRVEKFRMCQHPEIVAGMIAGGHFTIDHVHPNALKNEIVWAALLPRMDVRSVLKYIPKIAQLGFLKKDSKLTEIIVEILTDPYNLKWNKVLPGDISKVLNRYAQIPEPDLLWRPRVSGVEYDEKLVTPKILSLSLELAKILDASVEQFRIRKEEKERLEQEEEHMKEAMEKFKKIQFMEEQYEQRETEGQGAKKKTKRRKKKFRATKKKEKKEKEEKKIVPVKAPNQQIIDALQNALNLSLKVDITEKSDKRYAVAIKMPPRNWRKTSCAEVGLTLALPLINRENAPEDATTIIFHHSESRYGFVVEEKCKDRGFDDILVKSLELAKQTETWTPMGAGPIFPCGKKPVDVFINVTTLPPTRPAPDDAVIDETSIRSLPFVKKRIFPQTRFVNVLLNKAPFELKGDEWDEILTIRGFDTNVPFIIEAYARGLF